MKFSRNCSASDRTYMTLVDLKKSEQGGANQPKEILKEVASSVIDSSLDATSWRLKASHFCINVMNLLM